MMMKVVSLLLLEELSEVGVSSSNSFLRVLLLPELGVSEVTAIEHLASLSSLCLLDVVRV